MKVKYGHVPEELVYVQGAKRKIVITWEDTELEAGETATIEEVTPCYVGDSTNKKTTETGRSWAKQTFNGKRTPVEVIRKNEPISGLRIMGQDYRHNGASVYKVVDPEGNYFDFRDDVMLDAMRTAGVSPGGILNGEYKWARIGTATKLVRIGSALHTAVEQANVRVDRKRISLKDVVPGNLYETKSGTVYLFVGMTRGWNVTCSEDFKSGTRVAEDYYARWHQAQANPHHYGLRQYVNQPKPVPPPRLEIPWGPYKERLWLKITDFAVGKSEEKQKESIEASVKRTFDKKITSAYSFEYMVTFTNPPVNGHLGEYSDPTIIEKVRKYALDVVLSREESTRGEDPVLKARARLWEIAEWLKYGTVYEDGQEPHESHDAWATWMLSTEPK